MKNCRKCNSENMVLIEQIGALETWRCGSCGKEETIHVFQPSMEPSLPKNLEPVFQIVGRWVTKPSMQQISEIQGVFPALRKTPPSTLLRRAIEQSDIELGRFTESEMQKFNSMLERVGMTITRTPI